MRTIIGPFIGFFLGFKLLAMESHDQAGEKNVKFREELGLDLEGINATESSLTTRRTSPKDVIKAFLLPKKKSPKKDKSQEEEVVSPRVCPGSGKKSLSSDHFKWGLSDSKLEPQKGRESPSGHRRPGSLQNERYFLQSVRTAPESDNIMYLKCVLSFNFREIDEKKLVEELFSITDAHGFSVIEGLSAIERETATRNSESFKREYEILRDLWRPLIKKALSNHFCREDFWLTVNEWKHIERFQNYISLCPKSQTSGHDLLPMKDKIAGWEKIINKEEPNSEEAVPCPEPEGVPSLEFLQQLIINEPALSEIERSYLTFLVDDVSSIIVNAPVQYRIFFIELYLALASKFKGEKVISFDKAKSMALNSLFLYVIQLVLFDIRIEKVSFNKIEIGKFATELGIDFSSLENKSLDKKNQAVMRITNKMRDEATKRLQGEKFFESQLMQIMVQTFGVTKKRNFSTYQVILDAIKRRMVHLLLLLP